MPHYAFGTLAWFSGDMPPKCGSLQESGSFARGRCRRGRSEIPHFCSNLQSFPLSSRRIPEKRRRTKRSEEKREKKRRKTKKDEENSSDPIYTNPIKNLPKELFSEELKAVAVSEEKIQEQSFFLVLPLPCLLLEKGQENGPPPPPKKWIFWVKI